MSSLGYNNKIDFGAVMLTARILHLIDLVMLHRAICILFLLCAWNSPPILAQGGVDIFTAVNLPVDVTAESALEAREKALQDGQRMALRRVLTRITLRTDHSSLPEPDDKAIEQMVATVAVANEKTSTVRYLAKVTVRFHRAAVRQLLLDAGIRFSETRAKPILVLPVLEKGAALSLFENSNIWRNAWAGLDLAQDALMPLRLPLGDLLDITTITAQAALAGRDDLLKVIAHRYEVNNILVAHAVLNIDLRAGGLPRVAVNLLRFGPGGKNFEVLDYTVRVGNDLEEAMGRLALLVAMDQQEQWKRRTQLSFGEEISLSALVPLSDLSDWLTVRKRLAASAMVSGFQLQGISLQDAQVVINYLGDADSLAVSLAQRDLKLVLVDGFWMLSLVGVNKGTSKGSVR